MSSPRYDWHRRFLEAGGMTDTTKLVGIALWDDANAPPIGSNLGGVDAYPGVTRLAARLGKSERCILACLERLRDSGWIERTAHAERRRGRADVYALTYPPETQAFPEPPFT